MKRLENYGNWSKESLIKELIHRDRMEEESVPFAHRAAHDLKAPLRGISTLCGFIEQNAGEALSGAPREDIRKILRRVREMQELVEGLLEYSLAGMSDAEPETVNIQHLLKGAVQMVDLPPGMVVSVAEGATLLSVHKADLLSVIQHLFNNAVRHHTHPEQGVIAMSCHDDDPHFIKISMEDDGPGIEREFHQAIFKPFTVLKSKGKGAGSGLGLAIAEKIIRAHGGRIEIDSDPGKKKGCVFRVFWPRKALQ